MNEECKKEENANSCDDNPQTIHLKAAKGCDLTPQRGFSPDLIPLELEVDERAAVGAHELVDDKDDERRAEHHQREGLRGEHDAVAALPFFGDPVDEHARDENEDDVDVFPGDGA